MKRQFVCGVFLLATSGVWAQSPEAVAWAKQNGYPLQSSLDSKANLSATPWALVRFQDQKPSYYITLNENAAISTVVPAVRQTAPYNVSGAGLSIGIWDDGSVLSTHIEVETRVVILDSSPTSSHGTHVGGTLAATGLNLQAKGMAPEALILSSDFLNDFSEIPTYAALNSTESILNTQKMSISNHSYGDAVGWINGVNFSGTTGVHYMDDIINSSDPEFGQYGISTREWDLIAVDHPYWLPFISAGNDRDDAAPASGTTFFFLNSTTQVWESSVYNSLIHPASDFGKGGFDTMIGSNGGKNVMTVGAVNDAVTSGARDLAKATMTNFSGWGPMDDGRIKPDIVANGSSLISLRSNANNTYNTASGTSMSSPNAAGSALLLQDYYRQTALATMPADLLKALIIHTADDIGRPGPDYTFGWGLMNTQAAAEVIRLQEVDSVPRLLEGKLSPSNPVQVYTFSFTNTEPLRATLCWIDPASPALSGLDNPATTLVHDLDLRVQDLSTLATYQPYRLNPASPTADATTGDNIVDNVEQVFVGSPSASGLIRITVSHKGTLTQPVQRFALVLTGSIALTAVGEWGILE